ncbi:isochorismate synthase [Sinosporangium album]|uniref:isochorismate synthase n=1 Tax=Sinosporangium album TaxID=504805 RepID=A0A1G8HN40_9ACTN|nr:isochorismate synthase DhbC [Sinosporangium album]SDI08083.1 isochorismate synthase [Sinosporangium album]
MTIAYEAVTAAELLHDYRPGSTSLFASPQHTLLGLGTAAKVPSSTTLADLRGAVAATLADTGGPIVGAIPFDDPASAHLLVPASTRWADPFVPAEHPRAPSPATWRITPVPSPADHVRAVRRALDLLASHALDKVVLARSLELRSAEPADIRAMVAALAGRDPHGYTFAVPLPQARTLVGASPELLVSRSGPAVVANPMAGSAARSADPDEDRRRAAALLCSAKDQHEHAVVVKAVAEALQPYCRGLNVPSQPSLICTQTMWHLSTRITGRLADPATTALDLACALHPTPAICGTPTDKARAAIADLEPFDRGYYTGLVGWTDARGDGEWAVTIRCAEIGPDGLRLFAGGGIVAESRPEDELAETTAKFRTLLNALGLDTTTPTEN